MNITYIVAVKLAIEIGCLFLVMVMVMNLYMYSAFSMYIYSNALYKYMIYEQRPDHNTGNYMPYSLR